MNEKYTPPCPHYRKCGGCQLQNLPYEEQLLFKQRMAVSLLGEFGYVEDIIGMEDPTHYRNKVHAAFGIDRRKNKIISGIYQSGNHTIVPVDECMIEDKISDAIILDIRKMLPSFKIHAYDERSGTGFLRHVLVKRGFSTNEIMVVLVVTSPIFKLQKPFVKKLLELHPEISTIIMNINDRFGPVVLGEREKVLYGKGYIEDILCGYRFRISAQSFYQINPVQTEKLYKIAVDYAGLKGDELVLDAYCGTGTIGITASGKANQVIGVEIVKDAVKDAIANAKLNGLKNCWFTAGDAGHYMVQMVEEGTKPDVVFMDPPRAGSDERFLNSLIKTSPKKVVYISCNPETLQRDLKHLIHGGYKVKKIQPVDMFPYTKHLETVVLLQKSGAKK
ncbi:MAG: 23S rRNA (uracil(1939)-C(5))-methyltransferase RlmD [Oscillospiraceae bacterium]|nr:23S rRNA (uracil(1939)-C(5))-methyltransferase RlmD [Oscillospiraceae bacterium]